MFCTVMYLFVTLWLVHYVTKEIRNCPYCGRKMKPKKNLVSLLHKFGLIQICDGIFSKELCNFGQILQKFNTLIYY